MLRTFTSVYDVADQLLSITDPDSSYSYSYDLAGRLITVDNAGTQGVPNVLLTHAYDDVNNHLSVTDAIDGQVSGLETYTYDELNRVVQITQSGNGVADKRVDFTYDAASQMTGSFRYASLLDTDLVVQSAYEFDLAGRLTSLDHFRGDTSINSYQIDYDANRVTRFESIDGGNTYNYDDRDQLTEADYDYQEDEDYVYDANGNRINEGYQTGLNNRLLSDGEYTYEFDGEGNRTQRTHIETGVVELYEWDYRNRLVSITTQDPDGTVTQTAEYAYDAFNRRILKTVDSDGEGAAAAETERFVYDGDHIALVFDGEGNQTHRYLHGPQIDQVLAEETADGEVRWALGDNQGTIRDVINNDGNVLNHISYDSFGQITEQINPTAFFRFGYTGREFDQESGQYYYRARYFDQQNGRFISEDPIGFNAGDSNLYRYVFNNSTNYRDPSGKMLEELTSTANHFIRNWWEDAGKPLVNNPLGTLVDAVEGSALYSEELQKKNAEKVADPTRPLHEKILPAIGGGLNSLWTPCVLKCLEKQLGLTITGGALTTSGLPIIPTRAKPGGMTRGTSPASIILKKVFPQKLSKPILAPTFRTPFAKSNILGRVGGRWVPIAGGVLLTIDAALIAKCTSDCNSNNC